MTRLTPCALVLGATALLSACAFSPEPQIPPDTRIQAQVCCSDFSQFPWVALQTQETLPFRIDASSPVGQFSDGKSYFAAFVLPERIDKVRLKLDSWMAKGEVFAPKLLALDAQFRVVSQTDAASLQLRQPDALHRASYQIELELQASKTPYLVIYSPESFRAGQIQVPHPARVRAEELGEARPMVTDPVYQHAPFGQLQLEIEPLTLRAAPAKAASLSRPTAEPVQSGSVQPAPVSKAPMLKETEAYYNRLIREAVAANDIRKALKLSEEATRAGSASAEKLLIELLQNK